MVIQASAKLASRATLGVPLVAQLKIPPPTLFRPAGSRQGAKISVSGLSWIAAIRGTVLLSSVLLASGCGGDPDATEVAPVVNGVDLSVPKPPSFGALDPRSAGTLVDLETRVEAAPLDPQIRREYASTLDAIGCDATALIAWTQASALDPEDAKSQHHIGRLQAANGNFEYAAEALQKATELDPSQASSQWRLGLARLALGSEEEARSAFLQAQRLAPNDPSGSAGLVKVALAEGDLKRADHLLTELLKSFPADAYLLELEARVKRRQGDEAAAALLESRPAQVTRCFRADPLEREVSNYRIGFAEDMARAREFLAAGRPEEALDLLDPLYAEDPGHLDLEHLVVQALLALGQTVRAKSILMESVTREDQPNTRVSLGFVQLQNGDYRQSLRSAETALRARPNMPSAHFLRAKALLALGRREESVTALESAFACGEKSLEARLLLGQSLAELEEYERARQAYTRATEEFPSSLLAWARRCEMEIRLGDTRSARRSLTEVAARDAKGILLPKLTRLISQMP